MTVSPELIAKLNALASRLTAQGEYEAVDLIDTVVERVSAMPQRELLAEALEHDKDDVERVARAICIDHTIDLRRAQDFARTAITAYLSAMPQRELLAEALEALQLIANCIHPRFRTEDDIDLLYANEKAFGQCINVARAAADKIRAALTQEKQT